MKLKRIFPLFLLLALVLAACAPAEPKYDLPDYELDGNVVVSTECALPDVITFKMTTELGVITGELYADQAPMAVLNFVTLAQDGYYDGLTFHRIVSDMMIQGGDPLGNSTGGESIWGRPFAVEWNDEMGFYPGVIAMANYSGKNTSQFFIVDTQTVYSEEFFRQQIGLGYTISEEIIEKYKGKAGLWWLDGAYTVFGKVTDGMDVVHAICDAPIAAGSEDKPANPVIVTKVEILTDLENDK